MYENYWNSPATITYDECQTLAGRSGASIITPFTIGLTAGINDNYWSSSKNQCNNYYWIVGARPPTYGMQISTMGTRSGVGNCMIGYIISVTTKAPSQRPTQRPSRLPTLAPASTKRPTPEPSSPTPPITSEPSQEPTPPTQEPSRLPTSPTAVPTALPTYTNTLHNTLSWSGYTVVSGSCTFLNSGVTQIRVMSWITWKQCVYEASKYGAMIFPSQYTRLQGWGIHRSGFS
jgi:hypothetical protein